MNHCEYCYMSISNSPVNECPKEGSIVHGIYKNFGTHDFVRSGVCSGVVGKHAKGFHPCLRCNGPFSGFHLYQGSGAM